MALADGTKKAAQNLANLNSIYLQGRGATPNTIKANAAIQKTGGEVVKAVVSAPFDIVGWLINNWQLAAIGGIALLILIKD